MLSFSTVPREGNRESITQRPHYKHTPTLISGGQGAVEGVPPQKKNANRARKRNAVKGIFIILDE